MREYIVIKSTSYPFSRGRPRTEADLHIWYVDVLGRGGAITLPAIVSVSACVSLYTATAVWNFIGCGTLYMMSQ